MYYGTIVINVWMEPLSHTTLFQMLLHYMIDGCDQHCFKRFCVIWYMGVIYVIHHNHLSFTFAHKTYFCTINISQNVYAKKFDTSFFKFCAISLSSRCDLFLSLRPCIRALGLDMAITVATRPVYLLKLLWEINW